MLNFTLVHSSITNVNPNQSNDVVITGALTGKHLVVLTESMGRNPKWIKSGFLRSEWDDSTIGRVRDKSWFCRFGMQRINLDDWQFLNPLVFTPVPYLVNIQVKIWSTADFAVYIQDERIEEKLNEVLDLLGG